MMTSIASAGASGAPCSNGDSCIQVDVYVGEHLIEPVARFHSTATNTVMQARGSELIKFFTEVKNGDWDHVITDMEFAVARHPTYAVVVTEPPLESF